MALPTGITFPSTPNTYDFAEAITVNTAFTTLCRAIYIGTSTSNAGSITVLMSNGDSITYNNLLQGTILPIRSTKVTSATNASNLVALF